MKGAVIYGSREDAELRARYMIDDSLKRNPTQDFVTDGGTWSSGADKWCWDRPQNLPLKSGAIWRSKLPPGWQLRCCVKRVRLPR
jgi:hypothetical protein